MKWELGKTYAFADASAFQIGVNREIREIIESNIDGLFQVSRLSKNPLTDVDYHVYEIVLSDGRIIDGEVARELHGFGKHDIFAIFASERKHFKEVECNRDFKISIDDCQYDEFDEFDNESEENVMPKIEVEGRIAIGSISSEEERLWLIDSLNRIKFK
ncbi:hypothetical protein CPT_Merlin10 [Citrobacter phage Merlin]|uniref:Uncharacterized protein n=1 Tax=Citrobacter phage Merlin TaxID=1675602 RepID=A0A0K1LMB7_9CAUD|nr:hypothetical protein CPT_Merlin10 [Citrobacter phage Merlin]AKU43656.1 hypothetical protein CPT_Merlin10 [Citrobacter phage Merlin]